MSESTTIIEVVVPERVEWWLCEGNTKEDLATMYWNKLTLEEREELVQEIDDACKEDDDG